MGYYTNVFMKYLLAIVCIVQIVLIFFNAFATDNNGSFVNLIEVIFPIFELLAVPKFKTKDTEDVNLNSKILKIFNTKAIMLMYILYCIIGLVIHITYIVLIAVDSSNETVKKIVGSEEKSDSTYIIVFSRTACFLIGLITSVFVRHMYKKNLEVYQGFS